MGLCKTAVDTRGGENGRRSLLPIASYCDEEPGKDTDHWSGEAIIHASVSTLARVESG